MKKIFKVQFFAILLALFAFTFTSCNNDDDDEPQVTMRTYSLVDAGNNLGLSGTATFERTANNGTRVTLSVPNAPGVHPAHIHDGSITSPGGIAFMLTDVVNGMSVTEIPASSGTTFDQMLTYNGYINVHLSADELETIVVHTNIGSNE
ncbi:CHRD domain-containing protein, partial [Hugenholtzia roseola]|uniref:CHRD domain-containing protein n=1 Tax=Hugenholtzia roseola TaxID=1002 RepID=UPI000558E597